jgi:hypothetical protein
MAISFLYCLHDNTKREERRCVHLVSSMHIKIEILNEIIGKGNFPPEQDWPISLHGWTHLSPSSPWCASLNLVRQGGISPSWGTKATIPLFCLFLVNVSVGELCDVIYIYIRIGPRHKRGT